MDEKTTKKHSFTSQPEHLITSGVVFIIFVALVAMVVGSSWVIGATIGSMHVGPKDAEDRSTCTELLDAATMRTDSDTHLDGARLNPLAAGRTITVKGRGYRLEATGQGGLRCLALSSQSGFSVLRSASGVETVSGSSQAD